MRKLFLILAVVLLGVAPLSAQSVARPRAPIAQRIEARRLAAGRPALRRKALLRREAVIAHRRAARRRARRSHRQPS